MRWRNFQGIRYVCSDDAPHFGLPEVDRVVFWQELVFFARHVRSTMDLPLLVGDANVWHPEFSLGCSRDLIVPLVDLVSFVWARADQSARSGNT